MSFLRLQQPNAVTSGGERVRVIGQPFSIRLPRPPGAPPPLVWVAALFADGKLRPVKAEEVESL